MVYRKKKKSPPEKVSAPSQKCSTKVRSLGQKDVEERGAAASKTTEAQEPDSDKLSSTSTKDKQKDPASLPPSGAAAQIPPQGPQPTRFSARVAQKRPRRDTTPPKPAPSPAKKTVKSQPKTRKANTRRQWESWSINDKNLFFEALCEHGKDFDAIRHVIQVKHKKRGDPVGKSKDQIRHFYYRTWHKICKHLRNIEHVRNKQAAELFGLINYGEIRKRLGPILNEKTAERLNELLHTGFTSFKYRGKNQRLRTPVCRALKKLTFNEAEKETEKLKVPDKVVVELRPKTLPAWTQVQSVSQNPRLRLSMKASKPLSSLITYLNKKWASHSDHLKRQLFSNETKAEPPTGKELRLYPPPGVKLSNFTIKPVEAQQPTLLSLDIYLKVTNNAEAPVVKRGKAKALAPNADKTNTETLISADTKSSLAESSNKEAAASKGSKKSATVTVANTDKTETDSKSQVHAGAKSETGVLLSFKGAISNSEVVTATQKLPSVKTETKEKDTVSKNMTVETRGQDDPKVAANTACSPPKEDLERYRKGWTKSTAGSMTLAEVYLLLSAPDKFILDYEWTDVNPQYSFFDNKVTNVLRRLVHIAATEYVEVARTKSQPSPAPTCAQCGKGLGKSPRGGTKNSSPATPKGTARSRARKNSETGSSTPKGRGGKTQGAVQTTATTAEFKPEEALAAKTSSDEGVFRVPQTVPIKPSQPQQLYQKSAASTYAENQQILHQISQVQRQAVQNCNFLIPPRPRQRRQFRKPLVVQRRLLPKADAPSRQIVAFHIGQNGSVMSVVPETVGDLGSFSQLPPPGGTVRSPGGTVRSPGGTPVTSSRPVTSAGQRVVARQLIPDPQTSEMLQGGPVSHAHTTASTITTTHHNISNVPSSLTAETSEFGLGVSTQQSGIKSFTSLTSVPMVTTVTSTEMQQLGSVSLSSAALPPPSISSLLDISLPSADILPDGSAEKLIDIALESTTSSFTGFLDNSSLRNDSLSLPSASTPVKPQAGPDTAWLNGEDFSLSNFLSESPLKKPDPQPQPTGFVCDNSRDSLASRFDVDSAFQSMMNENSLDYVAKFADLAAQISANAQEAETAAKIAETL